MLFPHRYSKQLLFITFLFLWSWGSSWAGPIKFDANLLLASEAALYKFEALPLSPETREPWIAEQMSTLQKTLNSQVHPLKLGWVSEKTLKSLEGGSDLDRQSLSSDRPALPQTLRQAYEGSLQAPPNELPAWWHHWAPLIRASTEALNSVLFELMAPKWHRFQELKMRLDAVLQEQQVVDTYREQPLFSEQDATELRLLGRELYALNALGKVRAQLNHSVVTHSAAHGFIRVTSHKILYLLLWIAFQFLLFFLLIGIARHIGPASVPTFLNVITFVGILDLIAGASLGYKAASQSFGPGRFLIQSLVQTNDFVSKKAEQTATPSKPPSLAKVAISGDKLIVEDGAENVVEHTGSPSPPLALSPTVEKACQEDLAPPGSEEQSELTGVRYAPEAPSKDEAPDEAQTEPSDSLSEPEDARVFQRRRGR